MQEMCRIPHTCSRRSHKDAADDDEDTMTYPLLIRELKRTLECQRHAHSVYMLQMQAALLRSVVLSSSSRRRLSCHFEETHWEAHPLNACQPQAQHGQLAWFCHFWTGCLHSAPKCSPECPRSAPQNLRELSPESSVFQPAIDANRPLTTLYLSKPGYFKLYRQHMQIWVGLHCRLGRCRAYSSPDIAMQSVQ